MPAQVPASTPAWLPLCVLRPRFARPLPARRNAAPPRRGPPRAPPRRACRLRPCARCGVCLRVVPVLLRQRAGRLCRRLRAVGLRGAALLRSLEGWALAGRVHLQHRCGPARQARSPGRRAAGVRGRGSRKRGLLEHSYLLGGAQRRTRARSRDVPRHGEGFLLRAQLVHVFWGAQRVRGWCRVGGWEGGAWDGAPA